MRNIDGLWRKYYAKDPLIDRPLAELDEYDLDVWAHEKIRRHSLTKTQYYNMTLIIRQSLELARLQVFNEEMGYGKGRVTAPMLDKRIRRYCRRAGIPPRGMHAIRRTYISTLIDAGDININYIRQQAGHADERTTYGNYCFNRKSRSLIAANMERALSRAGDVS